MFGFGKLLKPALAAAFLAIAPMAASAATVEVCGPGGPLAGAHDIGTNDTYNCDFNLSGPAAVNGSVQLDFFSNIIPIVAGAATANLGGAGASFTTAMLEWFDMPGGVLLGSVALNDIGVGFAGQLNTVFSGPAQDDQYVVLSWTGFSSNSGVLDINIQVAAIPLPAAGFLLLGALGGLGFMGRRRRKAA